MKTAADLALALRAEIASGAFPPGAPLPSVRDLALLHRLNPNTVVRAFAILADEGLVQAEPRRGHFAAPGAVVRATRALRDRARVDVRTAVVSALDAGLTPTEVRTDVEGCIRAAGRRERRSA